MIACLLPVITAPLTACWWLHDQGLDSSDERAREQTEAFLLNVHLPADGPHGWPTVFARLATSRRLKRLNITMCLIPRTCEPDLLRLLASCSALRKVDTCFAGDDGREYGWVDKLWNSVKAQSEWGGSGSPTKMPSPTKSPSRRGKGKFEGKLKDWQARPPDDMRRCTYLDDLITMSTIRV
jgi:hypothetical protein